MKVPFTSGKEYEVRARKYGQFAIHRTILWAGKAGSTFTVTHIKTRCAATTDMSSEAEALTLARALTAARLNWNFTNPDRMPKRTRERARQIVVDYRGY